MAVSLTLKSLESINLIVSKISSVVGFGVLSLFSTESTLISVINTKSVVVTNRDVPGLNNAIRFKL